MGNKYVVFVMKKPAAGSAQQAAASAGFAVGRDTTAPPLSVAQELALRRSVLSSLAASMVGAPGVAGAMTASSAATAIDQAAVGFGPLPNVGDTQVLEGVSAIVVDDEAVDVGSLRGVVGLTVFQNVDIPLPQPVIVTAAAPANDWHFTQIGLAPGQAGGSDVLIGILDTGIDAAHPKLPERPSTSRNLMRLDALFRDRHVMLATTAPTSAALRRVLDAAWPQTPDSVVAAVLTGGEAQAERSFRSSTASTGWLPRRFGQKCLEWTSSTHPSAAAVSTRICRLPSAPRGNSACRSSPPSAIAVVTDRDTMDHRAIIRTRSASAPARTGRCRRGLQRLGYRQPTPWPQLSGTRSLRAGRASSCCPPGRRLAAQERHFHGNARRDGRCGSSHGRQSDVGRKAFGAVRRPSSSPCLLHSEP